MVDLIYKDECFECMKNVMVKVGNLEVAFPMTKMIVCPDCGNKRCPKATFHENKCTNSNEVGQEGSRYAKIAESKSQ